MRALSTSVTTRPQQVPLASHRSVKSKESIKQAGLGQLNQIALLRDKLNEFSSRYSCEAVQKRLPRCNAYRIQDYNDIRRLLVAIASPANKETNASTLVHAASCLKDIPLLFDEVGICQLSCFERLAILNKNLKSDEIATLGKCMAQHKYLAGQAVLYLKGQLARIGPEIPSDIAASLALELRNWSPVLFQKELEILCHYIFEGLLKSDSIDDQLDLLELHSSIVYNQPAKLQDFVAKVLNGIHMYTVEQRIRILRVFSSYKQPTIFGVKPLLVDSSGSIVDLTASAAAQVLIALTFRFWEWKALIAAILEMPSVQSLEGTTPDDRIAIAYTICLFYPEGLPKKCLQLLRIAISQTNTSKIMLKPESLCRLNEICSSFKYDMGRERYIISKSLNKKVITYEAELSAALALSPTAKDVLKMLKQRFDRHDFQLNQIIGPYHGHIVSERRRQVIELDAVNQPCPREMRQRHFRALGYQAGVICCSKWFHSEVFEAKYKLIEEALGNGLID